MITCISSIEVCLKGEYAVASAHRLAIKIPTTIARFARVSEKVVDETMRVKIRKTKASGIPKPVNRQEDARAARPKKMQMVLIPVKYNPRG